MSSLWEQRAARNEALFREVNENIVEFEQRVGSKAVESVVLCECAHAECTEQFTIDAPTYRRVREHPRRFFVRPGHEEPTIEEVVDRHRDYLVVEKTGEAGQIAEQMQD